MALTNLFIDGQEFWVTTKPAFCHSSSVRRRPSEVVALAQLVEGVIGWVDFYEVRVDESLCTQSASVDSTMPLPEPALEGVLCL